MENQWTLISGRYLHVRKINQIRMEAYIQSGMSVAGSRGADHIVWLDGFSDAHVESGQIWL